jgi:uncharacterized protein (DUF1697 family)
MPRYVALFRAVNVAGHARISGSELCRIFTAAGARDVSSFGHAGNLLFSADRAPGAVVARARAAIGRRHGELPVIVLRKASELTALAAADPFAACGAQAADKLYVVFLARRARNAPRLPMASREERLTAFACRGRDVLLVSARKPNGFYGFPNAFVEAAYGVAATARNWSTVTRLARLLEASSSRAS